MVVDRRSPFSPAPPQVLSIAGSDPSGGAGIQADLKTFSSLGCYGMSVLSSLTAQNTQGVTSIHIPPVDFFRSQLRALWDDVELDAIKVGMLGNREVIVALSEELQARKDVPIVLDPVMVSTSGSLLLTRESIEDLIEHLLPLCTLLTPNLPEAHQLLSHHPSNSASTSPGTRRPIAEVKKETVRDLLETAKALCSMGPKATLVKGGHQIMEAANLQENLIQLGLAIDQESEREEHFFGAQIFRGQWSQSKVTLIRTDGEPYSDVLRRSGRQDSRNDKVVLDVLYSNSSNEYTLFIKPHVPSTATHGTGCTLSSAIAACLASGLSLTVSVHKAILYVQQSISRGLTSLGKGSGPLNHLCHIAPRPVLAPTTDGASQAPLCSRLIAQSLPYWRAFTRHPFLQQVASHSLPAESFIYFLKQDYLFLKNYARVWASGASSATTGNTFARIVMFAGIAAEMAAEADNHVKICEPWGITKGDLEHGTVESAATLAYTRFVLDVSRSGDALELLAATGPCLLGYGEAGLWIANERHSSAPIKKVEGFDQWIEYYAGEEYQKVVQNGIKSLEDYASSDPPSVVRMSNLQRIWNAALRLEIGMWDEALDTRLRREILAP